MKNIENKKSNPIISKNKLNNTVKKPTIPGFNLRYNQSQQQAFYFPINIEADNGDVIVAKINDIVIGYRVYSGKPIDVPVMGSDGMPETEGYAQNGNIPKFLLYKKNSTIFLLKGQIPPWTPNGLFQISLKIKKKL